MKQAQQWKGRTYKGLGFTLGLGITLLLAIAAKYLALLPFLSIMGQLVIAIMLGIGFRAAIGVPQRATLGISFASIRLLRAGIILLGIQLNWVDIVEAGPKVLVLAVIHIVFAILVVYGLARWLKVDRKLGMLTACGTAICGAAAVVAIAPQIEANKDETAIGAATVAILGTMFTLLYTVLYPYLGFSAAGYGIYSGATLHEVAHVVAAAAPGGQAAVDMAVIVKLTRVALLVPVAIFIGIWSGRMTRRASDERKRVNRKSVQIPWFILGFMAMSGLNTLGVIPPALTDQWIAAAYLLIAMAMAGLGLGVNVVTFRRLGLKSFSAGLIGSILLSILGIVLVHGFGLA